MYRFEIQLSPKLNNGLMQHYWHIFLIDGQNKITVRHGYADSVQAGIVQANKHFKEFN